MMDRRMYIEIIRKLRDLETRFHEHCRDVVVHFSVPDLIDVTEQINIDVEYSYTTMSTLENILKIGDKYELPHTILDYERLTQGIIKRIMQDHISQLFTISIKYLPPSIFQWNRVCPEPLDLEG